MSTIVKFEKWSRFLSVNCDGLLCQNIINHSSNLEIRARNPCVLAWQAIYRAVVGCRVCNNNQLLVWGIHCDTTGFLKCATWFNNRVELIKNRCTSVANIWKCIYLKSAIMKTPQIINKVDGNQQEWLLMIIIGPNIKCECWPQTTLEMVLDVGLKNVSCRCAS